MYSRLNPDQIIVYYTPWKYSIGVDPLGVYPIIYRAPAREGPGAGARGTWNMKKLMKGAARNSLFFRNLTTKAIIPKLKENRGWWKSYHSWIWPRKFDHNSINLLKFDEFDHLIIIQFHDMNSPKREKNRCLICKSLAIGGCGPIWAVKLD